MATSSRKIIAMRLLAASLVVVRVPGVVLVTAVAGEQIVREGEPAPETILADQPITEVDTETTETERQRAAESVEPVELSGFARQYALRCLQPGGFALQRQGG
jgi:hypothetical protein